MTKPFDVEEVRSRFPALDRTENGHPAAYLDGPGGTQVPQSVIDAMATPLRNGVSNTGGSYGASDYAGEILEGARAAAAALVGSQPQEIAFGQNMTSLTFALSRALAQTWGKGDALVLTSLDHDANFTPWKMAADDAGVDVRIAEFNPTTGLLDPDAVSALLDDKVRLVAICLASNALGSVVDIDAITAAAHEAGALVFVDAVHAGPHRLIDVARTGCDFLAASSYKFFGPHTGLLYGKTEHLAGLTAFKVRPAPSDPPGKWETGTQSFESLAGLTAAVDHMASLGDGSGREAIRSAFERIGAYERDLGQRFLDGIGDMGHVHLYGVPDMSEHRVTTFAVTADGHHPDEIARAMIDAGIYVWSGHYYAVNAMDRLGVLDSGGLVRIGFVHYNTTDEVDRALAVLSDLG